MDTEKLATSAIVESISLTDVLSPFINDGDKEPSWDGNIYIYEDKKKNKRGIKKVPVQVKGEKRRQVPPKKKPKYSVSLIDLDNWLNDGGIILFVVLIDESGTNKMIYYSALVPVLIRHLKRIAKGKKKISVPLKEFPKDNNKKVSTLLDFYSHMQKQTSFAAAKPSLSAVKIADFFMASAITKTAFMLIPAFEVATLTEEQTLFVEASASGILSNKALSPLVQPFSTSAEKPPIKSTLTASAALSKTFAK